MLILSVCWRVRACRIIALGARILHSPWLHFERFVMLVEDSERCVRMYVARILEDLIDRIGLN